MEFRPEEFVFLSRGGRVPRSVSPRPYWQNAGDRTGRRPRPAHGRLAAGTDRLRSAVSRPPRERLDVQQYLQLEFTVDD